MFSVADVLVISKQFKSQIGAKKETLPITLRDNDTEASVRIPVKTMSSGVPCESTGKTCHHGNISNKCRTRLNGRGRTIPEPYNFSLDTKTKHFIQVHTHEFEKVLLFCQTVLAPQC